MTARTGRICQIWIVSIVHRRIVLQVLEGDVHPAAFASKISCFAINQLLFGQIVQNAFADEIGPFNRTSRREGPARSALLLMTRRIHSSSLNPIHVGWRRLDLVRIKHERFVEEITFPYELEITV